MAFDGNNINTFTLPAGADLSGSQFRAVRVNSSGQLVAAALGQFACGILQNNPGSGQAGNFLFAGISKARLGGTVTAGTEVAAAADGRLIDATEARVNTSDAGAAADPVIASNVIGVALAGGVAGDIVPVLVTLSGAIPTTAA